MLINDVRTEMNTLSQTTMDIWVGAAAVLGGAGWILRRIGMSRLPEDLKVRVNSAAHREDMLMVCGVIILMGLYWVTATSFPKATFPLFYTFVALFFAVQFVAWFRFTRKLTELEVTDESRRFLSGSRLLYIVALLVIFAYGVTRMF